MIQITIDTYHVKEIELAAEFLRQIALLRREEMKPIQSYAGVGENLGLAPGQGPRPQTAEENIFDRPTRIV